MNSQASTEQSPQSSKSILDEIKKLKESLNSLTSQMADQHKVVQQLKQEVNVLKQNKNEPDTNCKQFSPENPLRIPASINIGGFQPPQVLSIQGQVPHDAIQFSVALKNASSGNSMLHINPRYNSGFVQDQAALRTDFTTGFGWGPEETSGGNPFPAGQPFRMDIECGSDCYMIRVNDKFWTSFTHRQDYNLINQLCIQGQVNVSEYILK
ncbi:hypothetical protein M8J75_010626 [Diaphorina citri]|nr:hypothetical protein M8J75_010626 [Diaphorina citri]